MLPQQAWSYPCLATLPEIHTLSPNLLPSLNTKLLVSPLSRFGSSQVPPIFSSFVFPILSSSLHTAQPAKELKMSQPANRYRKPTPSWRNDPDIISMETRILPKNTPPMAAPSGPKATRVFPLVQLPVRSTSSSATPECSSPPFGISQKRPRPLNSSMDPVHLKRHRIDVLEHSPEPKYEPDQPADYASQMGDHTMVAETRAASESGNKGMTEPVDNLASKTAAREASYIR
jgi:hypothetical protein